MTRINVAILPKELSDKHLIAEHREIKRIPNCVAKGRFSLKDQPTQFKLGTGHVKFFYDKLLYLKNRYESLYQECVNRGFNVTYYGDAWDEIPVELMNDYNETKRDREILLQRIKEKNERT
ncbi:MAG: pyrimidine dimer DNA glycosylase/endonuclease V [Candidatus Muirbacterium halophilum]|nr:pyrimidine dimer DNA glycosylase/endonuclease V [Candidatus Muirbacterium halophilum]